MALDSPAHSASDGHIQDDVLAFLGRSDTWGGDSSARAVERIDTHSAVVFLAPGRALKLKRAVRYSYLDFSTLELRRKACEAEVAINRRTAPSLYRGTLAITREAGGHLAIGGSGPVVDYVVEMARFDQRDLLDRMAADGRLELTHMPALAAAIARFHHEAHVTPDRGGYDGIVRVIRGNEVGLAAYGSTFVDSGASAYLAGRALDVARRHCDLLEGRRLRGFVRHCHGDLHLRNLVLLDGRPTPFDAIEFNDDLAHIDVWYDLAFLLMDLGKRGLVAHANAVMNGYLAHRQDDAGVALLPLFLSCRAGVRAMTSATAAGLQPDGSARANFETLAQAYLTLATTMLDTPTPGLVAVGGLSGSGKSTLARSLAPHLGPSPGAVVLRSDEVRKALHGVDVLTRLDPDAYAPASSRRVYDTLAARASVLLRGGRTVVVDAVHASPEARTAIETVAVRAGVPFLGLWLDASTGIMRTRVRERRSDVSDADAHVLEHQLDTSPGPITWCRLNADGDLDAVAAQARAHIERHLHAHRA